MACVSTCLSLAPKLTLPGFSSNKPLIRLRSPIDRYSFPGISTERFLSTHRKFNSHGIVVVKATSIDKVSDAIKPGGLVESDKLPTDVRKRAMEAVEECGRRVTVGDVSSRAGLKVVEAQKALQALAADTDGFLEVLTGSISCPLIQTDIEFLNLSNSIAKNRYFMCIHHIKY